MNKVYCYFAICYLIFLGSLRFLGLWLSRSSFSLHTFIKGPNNYIQALLFNIIVDVVVLQEVGNMKLGPVNWFIPIFVACSTFGCLNGLAFSGAR